MQSGFTPGGGGGSFSRGFTPYPQPAPLPDFLKMLRPGGPPSMPTRGDFGPPPALQGLMQSMPFLNSMTPQSMEQRFAGADSSQIQPFIEMMQNLFTGSTAMNRPAPQPQVNPTSVFANYMQAAMARQSGGNQAGANQSDPFVRRLIARQ